MSLFQCEECGCVENTALSCQGFKPSFAQKCFDWTGIEQRKNKLLCSSCGPTKYRDGETSDFGKWHNRFERVYLPKGKFRTNSKGNLEHKETGDTNYRKWALEQEDTRSLLTTIFVQIKTDLYTQPWRDYHSWNHIEKGIVCFHKFFADTEEGKTYLNEILFAWILHDAVCIPGFKHNEEASACLADHYGASIGFTSAQIEHVKKLIMQTKGHKPLTSDSPPGAAIINDMDLHEMGSYDSFNANSIAIKNEYTKFVAPNSLSLSSSQDLEFVKGQFCFFLSYYNLFPVLFKTSKGKADWQPEAKTLIENEIETLRSTLEDQGVCIADLIDTKFGDRSFLFKRLNESVE